MLRSAVFTYSVSIKVSIVVRQYIMDMFRVRVRFRIRLTVRDCWDSVPH